MEQLFLQWQRQQQQRRSEQAGDDLEAVADARAERKQQMRRYVQQGPAGDAGALAALSDHTADTDGWDDEFLPGYASGASDDGDLF